MTQGSPAPSIADSNGSYQGGAPLGVVYDPVLRKWVSDGLGRMLGKNVQWNEYGAYFDPILKIWKYPIPGSHNSMPGSNPEDNPLGKGSRMGRGIKASHGTYNPILGIYTTPPSQQVAAATMRRSQEEFGLLNQGSGESAPTHEYDPMGSNMHRLKTPQTLSERPTTAQSERPAGRGRSGTEALGAGVYDPILGEWKVAPTNERFRALDDISEELTGVAKVAPPACIGVYDPLRGDYVVPPADERAGTLTLAPMAAISQMRGM